MGHDKFASLANGGAPLYGAMVTFDCISTADLLSSTDLDYVAIDCQHSLISHISAGRMLHAIKRPTMATIVRVAANQAAEIGQVLDAGTDAVIVPMVNSADEARKAVAACRYAPDGVRSYGPIRRGMADSMDPQKLEARASCFVMIETTEAIANISEICAVPCLAGVYLGPGDLSISMGLPVYAKEIPDQLARAIRRVGEECKRAGIIAGIHAGSSARATELIKDGYRMLTLGLDHVYLAAGIRADLSALGR